MVAAVSKLFNLKGARRDIVAFGVPEWSAAPVTVILPIAELSVAILLISRTVQIAAIACIALTSLFAVVIAINLARGRKPACNCFGQIQSKPIGATTLIRNLVLIGLSVFVWWEGRTGTSTSFSAWNEITRESGQWKTVIETMAWALIAVNAWFTMHLLRQNGRLLLRVEALEGRTPARDGTNPAALQSVGITMGSVAPGFALPMLADGAIITLDELRASQRPVVLIFSEPGCGPCTALLPDIANWVREYSSVLTIAMVTRGPAELVRSKLENHDVKYVLLQRDREVATAYHVTGTPAAVVVDSDGRVGSFIATGAQAITSLVVGISKAAAAPSRHRGTGAGTLRVLGSHEELKIGSPAPPLNLSDLNGRRVDLAKFRDQETLVLFWNPDCGFCSKMLPDLKRWEIDHLDDVPRLLVVSAGSTEANRSIGLRAPILLDGQFDAGRAFRVRGTPAAILIDRRGKIASGVASGAAAIFALANAHAKNIQLSSPMASPVPQHLTIRP